ncbi:serine/threonine protein kinase [Telmatocola sphagniphila]|uniref:Serine/threonine protein kinase n=1 Tax=Telmatocola sphagniphila TaxID=1123043 RepID=A0A8E6EVG2_9BACT|nr:serine/threonine-protein kinase [Telmatocola sphagniphila]QVL32680.1 serine/threonine protein kinase [Telmatocola sphagniphila]
MNTISGFTNHPPKEVLAAFALGKSIPDLPQVANHVSHCLQCKTLLDKTSRETLQDIFHDSKLGGAETTPEMSKIEISSESELPPALLQQSKYTFLKKLGGGGMGVVWLAEHKLMKRKVAVKLIPPELIGNPAIRDRFLQEVISAGALEHPNVVRAYSAEKFGEYMLFEMEFVDGRDLGEIVKNKGPLSVPQSMNFIRQAAQALQYGMSKSLVHRDIKPGNLMLTRGGTLKVADFGLAKFNRENDRGGDRSLTGANEMMGTPDYMAPEQARNAKTADIRADIYSLGCTFFFLLTGKPPFEGASIADLIFKHWDDPRPDVSQLRNDVSSELSRFIQKMMAKSPAERPQTPKEVIDKLLELSKGSAVHQTLPASKKSTAELKPTAPTLEKKVAIQPASAPLETHKNSKKYIMGGAALVLLGLAALLTAIFLPSRRNVDRDEADSKAKKTSEAQVQDPTALKQARLAKANEEKARKEREEKSQVTTAVRTAIASLKPELTRFETVPNSAAELSNALDELTLIRNRFDGKMNPLPTRLLEPADQMLLDEEKGQLAKLLSDLTKRELFWRTLNRVENNWKTRAPNSNWVSDLRDLAESASFYPETQSALRIALADANAVQSIIAWPKVQTDFSIFKQTTWDSEQAAGSARISDYLSSIENRDSLQTILPLETLSKLYESKRNERDVSFKLRELQGILDSKPMTEWGTIGYRLGAGLNQKNLTFHITENPNTKIKFAEENKRAKLAFTVVKSETDSPGQQMIFDLKNITFANNGLVKQAALCKKLAQEVKNANLGDWKTWIDKLFVEIWNEKSLDPALKAILLRRTLDWVLKTSPELSTTEVATVQEFDKTSIRSDLNWMDTSSKEFQSARGNAKEFFATQTHPLELQSELKKCRERAISNLGKSVPQLYGWIKPEGDTGEFQNIGIPNRSGNLVIVFRDSNRLLTWLKVGRLQSGSASWDKKLSPGQVIFLQME